MTRTELQSEFYKETGTEVVNSQGEFDIDYVQWIERQVLALRQPPVSGSVYLTENQVAELANIGSNHLYLVSMDECRLSYGGVLEILKRYDEIRKTVR